MEPGDTKKTTDQVTRGRTIVHQVEEGSESGFQQFHPDFLAGLGANFLIS